MRQARPAKEEATHASGSERWHGAAQVLVHLQGPGRRDKAELQRFVTELRLVALADQEGLEKAVFDGAVCRKAADVIERAAAQDEARSDLTSWGQWTI
jgi:hypothetical protein